MTTLLDHTDNRAATEARPITGDVTGPARRLRATMAACRVQFTWYGTQKALMQKNGIDPTLAIPVEVGR